MDPEGSSTLGPLPGLFTNILLAQASDHVMGHRDITR